MSKLHGIPKDVSNDHEKGLKGEREDIKIIHNNVPCLEIMYVEEVKGYRSPEDWRCRGQGKTKREAQTVVVDCGGLNHSAKNAKGHYRP